MTRKIVWLVWLVGGALCLLIIVLGINTYRIGPPPLPAALRDGAAASKLDVDANAAAKRLAASLQFRTISHSSDGPTEQAAFRDLHDFLAATYPKTHASLKREVVNGPSLLFTWPGTDANLKPILLLAHMDVVPIEAGTEQSWTHPPFAGEIGDGHVWGRGSMDDKVSVLGALEAVEALLGQAFAPKRTVYLAFGHDEEVGGMQGAGKIAELLEQRGVRLDFTLDEGSVIAHDMVTGVEKPVALVGLAEKGYLTLEFKANAEGGHSSMPPPETAVGKISRAVYRLEENPMPASLEAPASSMFEYLGPDMPLPVRVVVANRWLFGPLLISKLESATATNAMIRTTTAATMVRGGVKENVLPSEATAAVNFRIRPGDTVEGVIEHVRSTIDDPDVEVRPLGNWGREPSPVSDSNSESFAKLRATILDVFPDVTFAPSLVVAGTDSRHYETLADNSYRFMPMRVRPEDLARLHGTNERIAIDNYAEIIRFYAELVKNTTH